MFNRSTFAALLALAFIGGIGGVLRPDSADVRGEVNAAPALQDPTPEPGPAHFVQATLYDTNLAWTTAPGTVVSAQLRDGTTVLANGPNRVAGDDGLVEIPLQGGSFTPGVGFVATNFIEAGHTIVMQPADEDPVAVDVPSMSVAATIDSDQIIGTGPASSEITVYVMENDGVAEGTPYMSTVMTGADGSFSLSVAGTLDLKPGDVGRMEYTDGDDNTFSAWFTPIIADVTLGNNQFEGEATPGDTVRLSVVGADGTARGPYESRVIGGTEWTLPAGGFGGFPGGGGGNPPFVAGDSVTVEHVSDITGASRSMSATLPDMAITSSGGGMVEGTAPAGALVSVTATSPLGDETTASAVTGADGRWVADLGAVAFGPGWSIDLAHEPVPGLVVHVFDIVPQIRVGLHRNRVEGLSDPGGTVTVTLLTGDGTEKFSDDDGVNGQGDWNVNIGDGQQIEPGDIVQVDLVDGDPVIINIEDLSASTDWRGAETVSGVAPEGTQVTVTQGGGGGFGGGGTPTTSRTVAVSGGAYSIDFGAAGIDLEPDMSGEVSARLLTGHEIYTYWSAVRMTVEVGDGFLSGNGPNFRDASAELVDPDGTVVVAAGTDGIGGGGGGGFGGGGGGGTGGNWFLDFEDVTGEEVIVRPGDIVRATIGDDTFEITVPPLRGVAFVTEDTFNGLTGPDRDVEIQVTRPLTTDGIQVTVTADDAGRFSHDFAPDPETGEGGFDLQHNDAINLQTREEGHNVNSQLFVPGLTINLDTALLTGSWQPDTEMDILLARAGDILATHRVMTAFDASFNIILRGTDGERTVPMINDRIIVQAVDDPLAESLELIIPELTVDGDVDADTIGGRATPGSLLTFAVRDGIGRSFFGGGGGGGGGGAFGAQRVGQPEINEDGTWGGEAFLPPFDVRAGTYMQTVLREPSGHRALRFRYVPMLNIQHGGAGVCGFARPRDSVSVNVADGSGASVGSARTTADYDSTWNSSLSSGSDPVFTESGNVASAMLGSEAVEVALPDITVSVDWEADQVSGTGPAGEQILVVRPARGCLDLENRFIFGTTVNPAGEYQINNLPGPDRDPGEGIEIAWYDEAGHRVYRLVYRSLGQIYVRTDRVAGRATPNSPVQIIVTGADGSEKGRASAFAGDEGYFDSLVADSGGTPIVILPGDIVRLSASGEDVDVQVEELSFDWSPGSEISGKAVPGRLVGMRLVLADGDVVDVSRVADDSGFFFFGRADVPPRADWTMADVRGVLAVVVTDNQHQIVAATGDIGDLEPIEPPVIGGDTTIYMPYLARNW